MIPLTEFEDIFPLIDMPIRGVVYTEIQVDAYLVRIGFPSSAKPTADDVGTKQGLEYLRLLQKYHMQAVPFENLNLHYTKAIIKSLAPKDLYEKIVQRRWGGTCTENNNFFGIVLRSLGFKTRPIGARVHKSVGGSSTDTGYFGWNHCVNLVTFDGQKYLVDVAMGPTTPAEPIPLGEDGIWRGTGLTTCRLRWDAPEDATDPDSKMWIYEQNNDGKSDFKPTYCFSELEFSYADYEVMKAGTTFNRQSWFTWKLVCVRTLLDVDNEPTGSLVLVNNSLRRKFDWKTEHIATFKHEGERIAALKEWFGIELNEDEAEGIKGMVSALPDTPHGNDDS